MTTTSAVDAAFQTFHTANPGVYALYKQFALELWAAGRRKMSSGLIIERIRWEACIRTTGDQFKVNDRWEPRYARMLAADVPQFADAFNFRRLRT